MPTGIQGWTPDSAGNKRWRISYQRAGVRRREVVTGDLAHVKAVRARRMLEGAQRAQGDAPAVGCAEAVARYVATKRTGKRSGRYVAELERCLLGALDVADRLEAVGPDALREWLDGRNGARESQKSHGFLVGFFRHAVAQRWVTDSPMAVIPRPEYSTGPRPWLTPRQWLDIYEATTGDVRDMLLVLTATGMRVGSLLELGPQNLSPAGGPVLSVVGKDTRGGRKAVYPVKLTARLLSRLAIRDAVDGRWFPYSYQQFARALAEACVTSGVRSVCTMGTAGHRVEHAVTPHILRHTCATWMVNYGPEGGKLRLEDVMAQLGHAKIDMARRYSHFESAISYPEGFAVLPTELVQCCHWMQRVESAALRLVQRENVVKTKAN